MRACKRCRFAVPAKDGEAVYYSCALLPPRGEVIEGKLQWIRPPMAPDGWCGQFKASLKRLIWGHGAA